MCDDAGDPLGRADDVPQHRAGACQRVATEAIALASSVVEAKRTPP
jgi:hypothetical protein